DDRNAELSGKFDHFLSLCRIFTHIVFGILDAMRLKILLCEVAKVANRGAVDGYWLRHSKEKYTTERAAGKARKKRSPAYSSLMPRPRSRLSHQRPTRENWCSPVSSSAGVVIMTMPSPGLMTLYFV